ncbi:IS5 family transposase [Streptomyces sp. CRCS-T-1]|uniref:IS5 family transposase n=1 Tax=Streptomyces TaxID=1883 RepID=UPI0035212FA4
MGIVERLVPDELWKLFQRVVPEAPTRVRRVVGLHVAAVAVRLVRAVGATAHRRFTEWSKARVWAKLHRLVLDELGFRRELDWSRCAIDSVNMRALKKGEVTGPNPVDRGKYGSKIHLITERTGLPLSVGISGANLHDSQALVPLVQGIPPIRSRRGRRRRRPGKLHGNKGCDYNHLRRWLRSRGITPRLARKGKDSSQRLGQHRWAIERTMAWLGGCRRPHRRYERKASHFLASVSIACTLICYRRLTSTDDLQDASA